MNAYYHNTGYAHGRVGAREGREHSFGDSFINFICNLIAMITCPAAAKLARLTMAGALLIAFIGVVGGIEAGTVSVILGVLLCGAITICEYLLLRNVEKNVADK